ncbi:MAG TPA: type II toxin-antitoxin system RelE/ParE family toxin [Candidatus Saccharibacteria bacterium]|jgi:addiction module RelE/StbE family toxin|nr:type II toxin-antitoxin system RelE/ParE family toxin [Candidatus Saccharibacteria bacterium]
MDISYKPSFKKQFKRLDSKTRDKFKQRLELFMEDPRQPALRLHPLKGTLAGMWSINVTGDIRAVFKYDGQSIVIFYMIGTHSQLY